MGITLQKSFIPLLFACSVPSLGATEYQLSPTQFLPPTIPWQGKSEQLIMQEPAKQTPIESSNFQTTPDYAQTIAYIEKLSAKSPLLKLSYFGHSAQGRPLPLVHVSSDFSDKNRTKLLAQAGIHAGEIDGKDAGLMLLRDIANGDKAQLVNSVDLLFVPIFNADGHENSSMYNRVNQRGPTNMGWRSTAQNINLNRDYAKAQSIEMQAMLALINQYQPSLYLDLHVTDGSDYQYDITYGTPQKHSYSPAIAKWFDRHYRPNLDSDLTANNHTPGPLVFAMDSKNFSKGIAGWSSTPRYSDGYGAARHLPTVLVENHSLKPYKQRVLGTYILIESSLNIVSKHGKSLAQAIKSDAQSRPVELALGWDYNKPSKMAFKGIAYQQFDDEISGTNQVKWLGTKKLYPELPVFDQDIPKHVTKVPVAYWLMPEQLSAIEVLKNHGIKMEILTQPTNMALEQLMAYDESFGTSPYEGKMRALARFNTTTQTVRLPKGAVKIPTDQALGKLAVTLLEPMASDSLFQWGFFNTIFQRTEYIEGYAIVPLAKEMLVQNPDLAVAFKNKLASDKDFADDPRARLAWFYQQSPFYDRNHRRLPIMRQW